MKLSMDENTRTSNRSYQKVLYLEQKHNLRVTYDLLFSINQPYKPETET